LDNNADLDCRTKTGKTPLHYACQYNKLNVAKLLLNYKSNYLARDINDNTPLHLAVEMGNKDCIE